jgi:hypothetical protein
VRPSIYQAGVTFSHGHWPQLKVLKHCINVSETVRPNINQVGLHSYDHWPQLKVLKHYIYLDAKVRNQKTPSTWSQVTFTYLQASYPRKMIDDDDNEEDDDVQE